MALASIEGGAPSCRLCAFIVQLVLALLAESMCVLLNGLRVVENLLRGPLECESEEENGHG
ncbi:hypothetical protein BV25DRAFT_1831521 [Artomyces pyxidatus]|uniref:Uncharacterized protein n=1 Tax=Artomyces pyxidatus TaxID=48021 RepID=A0ACB8SL85_9AGAM|nr:hypothetical protein BV25DRAFT_1831521 [Artomyces pyxidatus]